MTKDDTLLSQNFYAVSPNV